MCTSEMPQSRITSIWWASNGRLRIGRIGFGLRSEKGYMRAPLPAARMTPTMRPLRLSTGFPGHLAANQLAHDADRIEGANLLAFLERAPGKPHRHLGEARAALSQACGEFRLEVEAIGLNVHALDQRRSIHLVARHQVRHLDAVKRTGGTGHREVAHAVQPAHALDRSLEAAAVNNVGAIDEQRLEQRNIVLRVVFEIRILMNEYVAGGDRPEVFDHAAPAHILIHEDDLQTRKLQPR